MEGVKINLSEVIELYNTGISVFELAQKYNTTSITVKSKLLKAGVTIRTGSEQKKITMNKPDVKQRVSEASKKSQPKRKETNIKKYGSEVASNGVNWKDEYEKENGVRHPNQKQEFKEKMSGENNPAKREESREKIKQNRWANKTEEELKEIWEKTIKTWNKNLDTDNPMKNPTIVEKVIETNLKERGVEWITQDPKVKEKGLKTHREKMEKVVLDRLSNLNLELVDKFISVIDKVKVKCKKCNNIFESVLDYVFHEYGLCPICNPKNSSKPEREIGEFLEEFFDKNEITYMDRKVLEGREIDILIKTKNIGIELDGLFYHSDIMGITENYHLNKTKLASEKGIRLIHVFEDEWYNKKDIVKSRIKRILGIDNKQKIYARKCVIKEIDSKTKDEFLDKFHIQGKDISSIRLGAFYNNELASVMTFSKGNISKGSKAVEGIWELNRFCNKYDYSVIGIAGKLLSYFKRNYNWIEIFSYCDLRWSVGNTYYKIGFELDKITKPNYWYVKNINRIHRFNLRKRPDEPKDIPEYVLRKNEGYNKIWDCGSLKFIIKNQSVA